MMLVAEIHLLLVGPPGGAGPGGGGDRDAAPAGGRNSHESYMMGLCPLATRTLGNADQGPESFHAKM
jgi:hypothetical protein